jgi:hypothetical protein
LVHGPAEAETVFHGLAEADTVFRGVNGTDAKVFRARSDLL